MKPPPGRCVHCLQHYEELTWDHIFPQGWYPNTTPKHLEKWKVPSCVSCNNMYSRVEEELFLKFALSIDPQNPRGAGVAVKGIRALREEFGKNQRDALSRKKKMEKLLRESAISKNIPKKGIYPGFEYKGKDEDDKMSLLIEKRKLSKFIEKIVRGITYLEDKQYIEYPYHIDFHAYNFEALRDILENIYPGPWEVFERPPGMAVLRATAQEDRMSGIYLIDIWGQLFCIAIVSSF
ncbi:MAG: hypothetical protein WBN53_06725 [Thermodesulfobacteriota bacterium]